MVLMRRAPTNQRTMVMRSQAQQLILRLCRRVSLSSASLFWAHPHFPVDGRRCVSCASQGFEYRNEWTVVHRCLYGWSYGAYRYAHPLQRGIEVRPILQRVLWKSAEYEVEAWSDSTPRSGTGMPSQAHQVGLVCEWYSRVHIWKSFQQLSATWCSVAVVHAPLIWERTNLRRTENEWVKVNRVM